MSGSTVANCTLSPLQIFVDKMDSKFEQALQPPLTCWMEASWVRAATHPAQNRSFTLPSPHPELQKLSQESLTCPAPTSHATLSKGQLSRLAIQSPHHHLGPAPWLTSKASFPNPSPLHFPHPAPPRFPHFPGSDLSSSTSCVFLGKWPDFSAPL